MILCTRHEKSEVGSESFAPHSLSNFDDNPHCSVFIHKMFTVIIIYPETSPLIINILSFNRTAPCLMIYTNLICFVYLLYRKFVSVFISGFLSPYILHTAAHFVVMCLNHNIENLVQCVHCAVVRIHLSQEFQLYRKSTVHLVEPVTVFCFQMFHHVF